MKAQIKLVTLLFTFFLPVLVNGQNKEAKNIPESKFTVIEYQELPDPNPPKAEDWAQVKGVEVSWVTTNKRFPKTKAPAVKPASTATLQAWKGERVSIQALVWSKDKVGNLRFELSSMTNKKDAIITKEALSAAFVRFVMTDELNKDGKGSCGYRPDHTLFDSSLVADPIDQHLKSMTLQPMNTQSIWVKCEVPRDVPKGLYKGNLKVYGNNKILAKLRLEIKVSDRTLPPVEQWETHLDLWQNPFAIARYYQTPLWSDAHFEAMKPYMLMLAEAGQKVITTSIIHKPWNGQTFDYFETMLTVIKKADETWMYDYTIFDKWVEFMMDCGIDDQINCFTMVPWELSFKYYDQATNSIKLLKAAPGMRLMTNFGHHFWKTLLHILKKKAGSTLLP